MTKTTERVRFTAPGGDAVTVRVLPQGDGRIYTGEADDTAAEAVLRFPTYQRGDLFAIERETALALEHRGLVEIQP